MGEEGHPVWPAADNRIIASNIPLQEAQETGELGQSFTSYLRHARDGSALRGPSGYPLHGSVKDEREKVGKVGRDEIEEGKLLGVQGVKTIV
jgi:hypothetical protein